MEDIGMTMMQMAELCDVRYNEVLQVVKKERIKGKLCIENNRKYFDKYQQDIIFRVLYFEGKATHFIIPSSMNKPTINP